MKGAQSVSAALRSAGADDVTSNAVARVTAARPVGCGEAADALTVVDGARDPRRREVGPQGAAGLAPIEVAAALGATAGRPVSAGVMHDALSRLESAEDLWSDVPPREAQAMRWVLRGEMRKLAALDRYASGVVRA